MPYTHTGKQMFLDGRHVADAASDAMAGVLCENLNRDRETAFLDANGDVAVAIGEHGFRAGYAACIANLNSHGIGVVLHEDYLDAAWSEYTPPDELCGVSLFVPKP